jgi:hypothetical protein
MNCFVRCAAAIASLMIGVVVASAQSSVAGWEEGSPFKLQLTGSYLYGPVDGFIQTPSGGEAGTTSRQRPRFREMGINTANIGDVELDLDWRNDRFFAGGQFIDLSGSHTLDEELISQGVTFPAGTAVSSDVRLDWYRFGYQHAFRFGEQQQFTVAPSIAAVVLDYHYKLDDSAADAYADRSFIKVGPQFGIDLEWHPNDGPFSLELFLAGAPRISSMPAIFQEELRANYRFLRTGSLDLTGFVGVEFEQIRFEDGQSTPNRISADFGPMFLVGLSARF